MQHHPTTRTVQASTIRVTCAVCNVTRDNGERCDCNLPDYDSTPTLVETIDGLAVAPRWMADILRRVHGTDPVPVQRVEPTPAPTLWDVTS